MDNRVGIRELQQQAPAVISRVRDGEILVLTDHGHPVARIMPAGPNTLSELAGTGLVSTPDKDITALLDRIPQGELSTKGTDALRELRKEQ